ncbi:MAG: nicotinate-nucleotide adenylyltransferase [Bacteroidales bacterium]|nr:nicotinate-nucleotide adenylyltransferase [Bacteroidales bacterium]
MKHVGLFFGSFNPIHVGHLIIANTMLELTDMKEVWFVVSPQNPLKEQRALLADHHRLQMVRIAIDDNYAFSACDVEFSLPKPSYTAVTLAALAEKHPDKRFSLIMGGDNLQNFRRWRNYEYILENYHLYVFPRPNASYDDLAEHPHVHFIQVPMMDISSSYIRQMIADGHPPRYLLTDAVFNYLTEMHFYESRNAQ